MLTKLTIRNFKRFDAVEIELGQLREDIGHAGAGLVGHEDRHLCAMNLATDEVESAMNARQGVAMGRRCEGQ